MKLHSYLFFTLLSLTLASCQKNENQVKEIIPLAPSDLTGKLIAPTQIQLNWIDKSTNEKGFRIQRKSGNGNFALLDSVGLDITTYTDKNILIGQSYTYRVVSFNTAGISITYSNEVTIATISLPVLQTIAISDTTGVSATSGGQITSDGGSPITARGVVWSTSSNPEITLATKTSDGTGTGVFSSKLSALKTNTKYYVRAFATNLAGTAYGQELSFTTFTGDIQTGLIAFYPFSGNAIDSSGNGNNGIVNGATLTTDRFSNNNKAYYFDGASNSIVISNFNQNPAQFSISLWFFPTANGHAGSRELLHRCNPSNLQSYCWNLSWAQTNTTQGNYLASGLLTNSPYWNETGNNLQLNQWYHAVMTFDGNIKKVYLNGILINTTSISGQINYQDKTGIYIGFDSYWDWYQGKIDDIRFYNRILQQEDVNFLTTH